MKTLIIFCYAAVLVCGSRLNSYEHHYSSDHDSNDEGLIDDLDYNYNVDDSDSVTLGRHRVLFGDADGGLGGVLGGADGGFGGGLGGGDGALGVGLGGANGGLMERLEVDLVALMEGF